MQPCWVLFGQAFNSGWIIYSYICKFHLDKLRLLVTDNNFFYNQLGEISCRWNIKFPAIVEKSISILSSGGLGMAMFSLGTIMQFHSFILVGRSLQRKKNLEIV